VAVDLQAERIREAIALGRERHDDGRWRVDADAHFLLVAVCNGLRFAERLQGVAPDSRLAAALAEFTRRFPQSGDLRNVLTHFEEYVLDEGHLQRKGSIEPGSTSWRVNMADGASRSSTGLLPCRCWPSPAPRPT
jgi:hypothetical protein